VGKQTVQYSLEALERESQASGENHNLVKARGDFPQLVKRRPRVVGDCGFLVFVCHVPSSWIYTHMAHETRDSV